MDTLNEIVKRTVNEKMDEMRLRETIKRMIRESLFNDMSMDENIYDEDAMFEKKKKHNPHPEHRTKHSKIGRNKMSHRRTVVINALNPDKSEKSGKIKLDIAPYAYKLWPDKDEDSARSYFYKCLKGELNDSGVPYEFKDNEINRLYSMLTNNMR